MIQELNKRGLLTACATLVLCATGACAGASAVDLARFPDAAVDESRACH